MLRQVLVLTAGDAGDPLRDLPGGHGLAVVVLGPGLLGPEAAHAALVPELGGDGVDLSPDALLAVEERLVDRDLDLVPAQGMLLRDLEDRLAHEALVLDDLAHDALQTRGVGAVALVRADPELGGLQVVPQEADVAAHVVQVELGVAPVVVLRRGGLRRLDGAQNGLRLLGADAVGDGGNGGIDHVLLGTRGNRESQEESDENSQDCLSFQRAPTIISN